MGGGGHFFYPHPVITGTVEGEAKKRLGAKWRKYGNNREEEEKVWEPSSQKCFCSAILHNFS